MERPTPVLAPQTIYSAWDRWICATPSCAGASALFTGVTIGGYVVTPVTAAEVKEWQEHDLGALTCECGRLTGTLTPGGTLRIQERQS